MLKQEKISKYWLVFDSESTVDITNIRIVKNGNEMKCIKNGESRLNLD